jgi:hypothetical protein
LWDEARADAWRFCLLAFPEVRHETVLFCLTPGYGLRDTRAITKEAVNLREKKTRSVFASGAKIPSGEPWSEAALERQKAVNLATHALVCAMDGMEVRISGTLSRDSCALDLMVGWQQAPTLQGTLWQVSLCCQESAVVV